MKKANDKVIRKAFARLATQKEETVRNGMVDLLEDAVKFALENHDESHQSHIKIGDTYGWMLVHNHRVEKISVVSTADNQGKATKMLRSKLISMPAKGWIGVVMAGMEPANYFMISYEKDIINNTIQMTKQMFTSYFTKI